MGFRSDITPEKIAYDQNTTHEAEVLKGGR